MLRVACCATAGLLAACSGGSEGSHFTTKGLRVPITQCAVNPRSVARAEPIDDIDERNGCQVRNAWRVASMDGVQFSQPATMNCGMIGPLDDWMTGIVQPAAQRSFGESVVAVDVAASYSCRARDNISGAKMSEHGFGNAIDISGFTLESGRKVRVAQGFWGSSFDKRFIGEVRHQACADFNTVLGPGTDSYHKDHIHLDMSNRASGKYCR
jgi:hypothetical protein